MAVIRALLVGRGRQELPVPASLAQEFASDPRHRSQDGLLADIDMAVAYVSQNMVPYAAVDGNWAESYSDDHVRAVVVQDPASGKVVVCALRGFVVGKGGDGKG
jgi:hypothetical protein